MYDSWVVYHRTPSRRNLQRFHGRAQKYWDQFIRRVRFTKAALRQANIIENKCPSMKNIQVKLPHQRSPYAVKIEDRFVKIKIIIKEAQYLYSLPKDRICEVCLQTKMTRALCRRRTGEALHRADKFGDLITADHKVLNEEGGSRNNHRYAVVVQDLATQWIPSFPCRTKTSQETEKNLRKFLEPSEKPKVIYTDNSLEFGKSCEDLSWNHRTSTPHPEGSSAVLLQSGLDERWWAGSMECYCYLRNVQDLLADGKTYYGRRFGEPFKSLIIPFGAMVEYHWKIWTHPKFIPDD